jgi:hypothetical protein
MDNLLFLEQEFADRIYLRAFDTTIRPGMIFRWSSKINYEKNNWEFRIGSDIWVQTKEKLKSIHAPTIILNTLDIPKEQPPFAYQYKLFGGIGYKIQQPFCDWYIGINGDGTIDNVGNGSDYTLSLFFEAKF